MKSKRAYIGLLALACWSGVSAAASWAVPLADLFQGQTITADDKRFTNFTLTTLETTNGGVVNTAQINVTPLVDDPSNPGIKFTAPIGALGTPFGHTGPSSARLIFSFDVSTTSGLALIKDNSLLVNGFIFDSGPLATIIVSEQVSDAAGNPLGGKLVTVNNQSQIGDPALFDEIEFAVQSSLHVVKQIDIVGPGTNDGAFLTMFEQRFSQVPEPNGPVLAAGLVVCGLIGGVRRRGAS